MSDYLPSPDIEAMTCKRAEVEACCGGCMAVTLFDVEAGEFVACCEDELLRAIIEAAGQELCLSVLGLKLVDEGPKVVRKRPAKISVDPK